MDKKTAKTVLTLLLAEFGWCVGWFVAFIAIIFLVGVVVA